MTAHLSLKYNYPLFKISDSNRTEKIQRKFGYDVKYQNVSIDDLGCDYYASSLLKWLSPPLGEGLLYVN